MTHVSPRRRVPRPLLVLVPLLVIIVGVGVWTDPSGSGGESQTAVQGAGAPTATPTTLSPQRLCERHVVQALTRLAVSLDSGGTSNEAVLSEQARLDQREYTAYSVVLNDFMMAMGETQGLAKQVNVVMPGIRRACS